MKQLQAINTLQAIETLAGSLVGIFIPIYLVISGYSLPDVLLFLIINAVLTFIIFILTAYLAGRVGLRNILAIRLPFLFIYLVLLYFLDQIKTPLPLLAIFNAAQISLYGFPLHVYFTQNAKKETMGQELGWLLGLPKLISVITPFIGGLITVVLGFKSLFYVAIFISVLSLFPLLYLPNDKLSLTLNREKIVRYYRKYKKFFYATVMENISGEAEAIIWPLFVYLVLHNLLSVGAIGSFVGAGGALFTYFIGRSADRHNPIKILKFGALIMMIIWLGRFFLTGHTVYLVLSLLAGFFNALVQVPYTKIFYQSAQNDQPGEFIVLQEIPCLIGRIIIYASALLLVTNLDLSFVLAGLSYILFFFF